MSADDITKNGERLRHLLHFAGDAEIADLIEQAACGAYDPSLAQRLDSVEHPVLVTLAAILRMRNGEKTLPGLRAAASATLRSLTEEEAEKAYEEAVPMPLSEKRLAEIVEFATRDRMMHATHQPKEQPGYTYCHACHALPGTKKATAACAYSSVGAAEAATIAQGGEDMNHEALKKLAAEQAQRILDDHLAALRAIGARSLRRLRYPDFRDALDNIGMDTRDVGVMFAATVKRAEGAPPLIQEIVSAIDKALSYVLGIPPYVNRNSRVEVAEEDAWSMNAALGKRAP